MAEAAEKKAAMMPSPVCFTSRPFSPANAARTMESWTPTIVIAASSPSRCVRLVDPTISVKSTVRVPGVMMA